MSNAVINTLLAAFIPKNASEMIPTSLGKSALVEGQGFSVGHRR
jgi:hypothetical protein